MIDPSNDIQIFAATIWGEARGDGQADEHGVANVIANRVSIAKAWVKSHTKPHPLYGNGTFASACLAREQFDCWNQNDPNFEQIVNLNFAPADPVLAACVSLASQAIAGQLRDITNGATSYKVTSEPWPKSWGPEKPALAVLGHQSFYKL